MKDKSERSGSEVFIVDSSDETWKVLQYLPDWCQLSEAMDIATGYFEMGSVLRLGNAWQQVNRLRLLMGDEVTRRRKTAFEEGLKCATERLDGSIALPALHWPDDDGEDGASWIKAWAKAFDKEPLTREFFKRFDQAPELIQSDLLTLQRLDSAEAYSRAQLLLERLLFLYFLQNRGWLIQQRGYLLSQFESHRARPEEFTYYEGFLEKLFWTLASAPGPGNRLDGIPFLNGGLFDDDEFDPAKKKQNPPPRIRNATFAQVFDNLLEAFNFTVREDTPLDQDVAVGPEMLGKVFESIVLHAEAADPDAVAPDKRKATDSYYTPRIVVHYPTAAVRNPIEAVCYRIEAVYYPTATVRNPIEAVRYPTEAVCYPIEAVRNPIEAVCYPTEAVRYPTEAVCYPIEAVCYPIEAVHYPIEAVRYPIEAVCYPIEAVCYPGDLCKNSG